MKISILIYLQNYNHQTVLLKHLTKDLHLSNFLVTKNLLAIKEDLTEYGISGIQLTLSENEVTVAISSADGVFELSNEYLRTSDKFLLFHQLFLSPRRTLKEYGTEIFLSVSKVYNLERKLQINLAPFRIDIGNDHALIGDEVLVRKHLYTFYLNRFHALAYPFQEELRENLSIFLDQLEQKMPRPLSSMERMKLGYLLSIQNIRIDTGFVLEHFKPFIQVHPDNPVLLLIQHYLVTIGCPPQFIYKESYYIYSFLIAEKYLPTDEVEINFPEDFRKKSTELLTLVDNLSKVSLNPHVRAVLFEETMLVNYKYLTYSSKIIDDHREIFLLNYEQTFPHLFYTVKEYLFEHSTKRVWEFRDQLLMEYLFILTKYLPISFFEDSITMIVDFSMGERFNEYITHIVEALDYLNVHVLKEKEPVADIYLSDFSPLIPQKHHVLWTEPPKNADWEVLIQQVFLVKKEKYATSTTVVGSEMR